MTGLICRLLVAAIVIFLLGISLIPMIGFVPAVFVIIVIGVVIGGIAGGIFAS